MRIMSLDVGSQTIGVAVSDLLAGRLRELKPSGILREKRISQDFGSSRISIKWKSSYWACL